MNEWMKLWMNEWMNEWTNEWINTWYQQLGWPAYQWAGRGQGHYEGQPASIPDWINRISFKIYFCHSNALNICFIITSRDSLAAQVINKK